MTLTTEVIASVWSGGVSYNGFLTFMKWHPDADTSAGLQGSCGIRFVCEGLRASSLPPASAFSDGSEIRVGGHMMAWLAAPCFVNQ